MFKQKRRKERKKEIVCWRKIHNEEFHNLRPSRDINRMMKGRNS
jgi:hypothetical protein